MSQATMSNPALSLIVARARNGVIGMDGDMPWRLSEDLKRFRNLTRGKPVIMGRNTWDSLPKNPLPARPNIVVSRNPDLKTEKAWLVQSLELAIAFGKSMAASEGLDEFFIIGGATLYEAALPFADRLYLTEVEASPEGDTFFPAFDESEFTEIETQSVPADADNTAATIYRFLQRKPV